MFERGIIMDKFDEAIQKAIDVFGTAKKATVDAISLQKQKIDLSSLENKLKVDYAELAKIYFEKIKNSEVLEAEESLIVDSIKVKLETAEKLRLEISKAQGKITCDVCGKQVAAGSLFCNHCGSPINNDGADENDEQEQNNCDGTNE